MDNDETDPRTWTHNPDLFVAAKVASELMQAGVSLRLSVDGTQLLTQGPAGSITPTLASAIRANRPSLVLLAAFFPASGYTAQTEPIEVREGRYRLLDTLYAERYGHGLAGLPVALAATKSGQLEMTMADGARRILVPTTDESKGSP